MPSEQGNLGKFMAVQAGIDQNRSIGVSALSRKVVVRLRLSVFTRWLVYVVFGALFATGGVWLIADAGKELESGELWQWIATQLLMWHGGLAMAAMIVFGALLPLHVKRAWRVRRNRVTGI